MALSNNGNIIFGLDNYVDVATVTAGSEASSMPVTNLQDDIMSVRYRSAGINASNTYIDIDLLSEREFSLLGVFNHDTSRLSTYRWLVTTGAGATGDTIYDSNTANPGGLQFWERFYSTLSRRWEQPHMWYGQIDDDEASTYTQKSFHILDEVIFGRYLRLYIDDSTSGKAYFQLGRIYIGPREQLPYNFVWGSSEGAIDSSPRMTTLGGATIKDRRAIRRKATYRINEVREEENKNWRSLFKQIQNRIGKTKQIVVIPRPDNAIETSFNAMMCSQSEINDVVYNFPKVSSTSITVEEEK